MKLPGSISLEYNPNEELIRRLVSLYTEMKIVPPSKLEDALHVAISTFHEMDMLVTWNYRQLAGVEREARFTAANLLEGFTKPLRLVTPTEVAYP